MSNIIEIFPSIKSKQQDSIEVGIEKIKRGLRPEQEGSALSSSCKKAEHHNRTNKKWLFWLFLFLTLSILIWEIMMFSQDVWLTNIAKDYNYENRLIKFGATTLSNFWILSLCACVICMVKLRSAIFTKS